MTPFSTKENYTTVIIYSKVSKGLGESSVWMKKYIPFLYPGTLNTIAVSTKPEIFFDIEIDCDYCRPCKMTKCFINDYPGYIIVPPRVVYKQSPFIELGADLNLRQKFYLSDGDLVKICLCTDPFSHMTPTSS
jgi:CTP-dependent riboflavin kinase